MSDQNLCIEKAGSKTACDRRFQVLHGERDAAETRPKETRAASDIAWNDLQAAFDKARNDIPEAVKRAQARVG
ncbi:MAG: hypothetical protein GW905_09490 [Rhodobacterales bacterium]|nr:hypothetical protein [Rhodobacterales bacterium]